MICFSSRLSTRRLLVTQDAPRVGATPFVANGVKPCEGKGHCNGVSERDKVRKPKLQLHVSVK